MEKNATIKSTMLGFEDHGIMTAMIYVDFDDSSIGFGGYSLGGTSTDSFIKGVMKAIGVEIWEKLEGKHCRVRFNSAEFHAKPIAIGHIIKDEWFDVVDWSNKQKK